jgi:hypothetical protein
MVVLRAGREPHLLEIMRLVNRHKWQQLTELWICMADGTNDNYYRVQLILPSLLSNAREVSLKLQKLDVVSFC